MSRDLPGVGPSLDPSDTTLCPRVQRNALEDERRDMEKRINSFERRAQSLEDENRRLKEENERLRDELRFLRTEVCRAQPGWLPSAGTHASSFC